MLNFLYLKVNVKEEQTRKHFLQTNEDTWTTWTMKSIKVKAKKGARVTIRGGNRLQKRSSLLWMNIVKVLHKILKVNKNGVTKTSNYTQNTTSFHLSQGRKTKIKCFV